MLDTECPTFQPCIKFGTGLFLFDFLRYNNFIMAIFNWRAKRQIIFFGIFVLIAALMVAGLVWYFWPKPTCFDNEQNQGEEGVDCGGPCAEPCLGQMQDLSVLWVRIFKNKEGFYDAAALVQNPNLFAGLASLNYTFKIYDANNSLIAIKTRSSFVNPNEKQLFFEGNISVGSRIPTRAFLEFDQEKNWKYIKKEKSFLSIVSKEFINIPFPRLTAGIRNDALFDAKDIYAAGILYDSEGNAEAVSFTKIDFIAAGATQFANFTWVQPFEKEPASTEIIAITNLTNH